MVKKESDDDIDILGDWDDWMCASPSLLFVFGDIIMILML